MLVPVPACWSIAEAVIAAAVTGWFSGPRNQSLVKRLGERAQQLKQFFVTAIDAAPWIATVPTITEIVDVIRELGVDLILLPEELDKASLIDRLRGKQPADETTPRLVVAAQQDEDGQHQPGEGEGQDPGMVESGLDPGPFHLGLGVEVRLEGHLGEEGADVAEASGEDHQLPEVLQPPRGVLEGRPGVGSSQCAQLSHVLSPRLQLGRELVDEFSMRLLVDGSTKHLLGAGQ